MAARNIPAPAVYEPALINIEAEAALLGALMIDNTLVERVVEKVTADDFHDPLHRRIFEEVVACVDAGKQASPVTLRPHFEGDACAYLAELTQNSAALYAVNQFTDQTVDLARRRRLVDVTREAQELASQPGDHKLEDIASKIEGALGALTTTRTEAKQFAVGTLLDAVIQRIDDERSGKIPRGIQTALLPDWNQIIGDMRPGNFIILAARPGMGKTTVALNVAAGAAANGHGTLFISLEMDGLDLGLKLLADISYEHGLSPSFEKLEHGDLTRDDHRRLADARRRAAEWPLEIAEPSGLRLGQLGAMIRRQGRIMAARGQKLELVVIDYLQLLKVDARRKSQYEEISEVSKALKELARENGVAILALAQLNREVEKRDNKRPFMADLRDSGQIEQDADKVVFLYREEYYLKRAEPPEDDTKRVTWETAMRNCANRIEIYTDKVRKGAGGKRICYFFANCQAVRGSRYFEDIR